MLISYLFSADATNSMKHGRDLDRGLVKMKTVKVVYF